MLVSNLVAAASCLIAVFGVISAVPRPGVTRERHIIHAPIKFKIIHHYRVQKVPVIIKKHLYYIQHEPEKPAFEEYHPNHVHHDVDYHEDEEHHEEDYREPDEHSQEDEYGNDEYD